MTSPELRTDISRVPAELLSSAELQDFYGLRRNQVADYSAWLNLEVGIAKAHEKAPEGPTPQEHFNRAYSLFDRILRNDDEGQRFKPFVLAQLAWEARPIFEAKLAKEQIDSDTVANVHRGYLTVARSLAERFERAPDSPDVQSMFTTVIGMAVLSDLRDPHWFPRLSSSRERLSSSFAHLAPFPGQKPEVTQPLAFVMQGDQQNHANRVVQVDIGTIAAYTLSYAPSQDGNYSSRTQREGLFETLDILNAQERDRVYDPRVRDIATAMWNTISSSELENAQA